MKSYVIDASVVATSLLRSKATVAVIFQGLLEKAERGDIALLSSKLLLIEVANALRFGVKEKDKSLVIYKDFLDLPIQTLNLSKSLLELSLKISYELGASVYDTSYHVLAKAHRATFLTCDDSYVRKAKQMGSIEHIG